jgi:F-type H+-transporting ATPase subunit b
MPYLRFSPRVLWLAALVFLAAALAVAPNRATAQESAPAAQSQTASAANGTAKSDAAPTQEEQENGFRFNGPLVKWAARTLNLPVETTARIFEFLNFAIIFFVLAIPLGRLFPKIIRKRSLTLVQSLQTAREATENANARLSAVEARLAGLDQEIAKYRAQVEQESLQDEARIKATIEEESARIVAAGEQELSVAAAQARRGLRHYAADLAIEQATKQMALSPETDRALIAEFIGDVAQGGKN